MRRLLLLLLATLSLVGLVAVAPAPAAGAASDAGWTDRATVDVRLPSGWRIAACEGDAPVLCATNPGGVVAGTVILAASDLEPDADTSDPGVAARVASFHQSIEEDRLATCGVGYRYERDPVQAADVGGVDGHRFGFTLRNGQGQLTERVVIHLAFAAGREFAVNTTFTDAAGCPGADEDRIEFPVSTMSEILPYLDGLVAGIALPADFWAGPACPPRGVPSARFTDTGGNPHRFLIDCLAYLGITEGWSDDRFAPARAMTRAHAAAFVGRMLTAMGEQLPEPGPSRFKDLRGHPHARVINQLATAGVVRGTSATTFEPDRSVTRAEAATLVVRAYEMTQRRAMYDAEVEFDDVDGVHAPTISRATTSGLVKGRSDGTFDPGTVVRRDEMAAIVGRSVNRMSWMRQVLPIGPRPTAGRA